MRIYIPEAYQAEYERRELESDLQEFYELYRGLPPWEQQKIRWRVKYMDYRQKIRRWLCKITRF